VLSNGLAAFKTRRGARRRKILRIAETKRREVCEAAMRKAQPSRNKNQRASSQRFVAEKKFHNRRAHGKIVLTIEMCRRKA